MVVVPNQVTVGITGAHLLQNPFLAHFEYARRGYEDSKFRSSDRSREPARPLAVSKDRLLILLRVFKFAIQRLHTAPQRSFQLVKVPDENDKLWLWSGAPDVRWDFASLWPGESLL